MDTELVRIITTLMGEVAPFSTASLLHCRLGISPGRTAYCALDLSRLPTVRETNPKVWLASYLAFFHSFDVAWSRSQGAPGILHCLVTSDDVGTKHLYDPRTGFRRSVIHPLLGCKATMRNKLAVEWSGACAHTPWLLLIRVRDYSGIVTVRSTSGTVLNTGISRTSQIKFVFPDA